MALGGSQALHLHAASSCSSSCCCHCSSCCHSSPGSGWLQSADGSTLDEGVIRVMQQALLLPGLAAHLIRSAGVLPWLAAAAVLQLERAAAGMDRAANLECDGGTKVLGVRNAGNSTGLWPLASLIQLLTGRVALQQRDQPRSLLWLCSRSVCGPVCCLPCHKSTAGCCCLHSAGQWKGQQRESSCCQQQQAAG